MLRRYSSRAALLGCLLSIGGAHAGQLTQHSPERMKAVDAGFAGNLSSESNEQPASYSDPLCDSSQWVLGSNCDGNSCDGLGGCEPGLLGYGLIKKSEACFDDFISPMTNPVYFEDPRQLTEARAIFINHKLPFVGALNAPGGRVQVYALQLRARLTENLSLIAVKDGFIVSQSPIVDDGWGDIGAGLKYTLFRDTSNGRLLSIGGRFEAPTGQSRALQGNGDGVFDFFMSGAMRLDSKSHLLTASGFIFPVDENAENQMWYWSTHLDRRIGESKFYALAELNWYHYLSDGNTFPLPIEGGDLFNLGSPGIEGNNLVTNAYGLKYKPNRNLESGVAWEFPLTERRGILDNRLTVDLIFRY
jgi:hypothetical protein